VVGTTEEGAQRTRKGALFSSPLARTLIGYRHREVVIIRAVAVEVDPAEQFVRPKRMRAVPAGSTAF
jgi:site-specific recombinase XerC